MCGVTVPLHSAEHFYVVTEQIEGVHRTCRSCATPTATPTSRRRSAGSSSAASSPRPSRGSAPDQIPYPFEFQLLGGGLGPLPGPDGERAAPHPALHHTGIKKFYNGPESFTPDNQFILGEAPEVRGFFVAAGFNSVGIASAGGAGRALAEWVVDGGPTSDLPRWTSAGSRRSTATTSGCTTASARCSACTTRCPWPNRELRDGAPVPPLAGVSPARGGRRVASAPRWAGSAPTSSHRRASP